MSKTDNLTDGGISQAVDDHIKQYFTALGDGSVPNGLYKIVLREVERPLFERCLQRTRGNQIRAAEMLGINRNTLRKKLTEMGVDARAYRRSRQMMDA
ncbi:MAG: hypothetical protein Alpg2KO_02720 [Alphaproteobacteria bacterium]